MLRPVTRELAQRLLAYEAIDNTPPLSRETASVRVYEKLRRSLSALAGVAGFHSLASRALTLAKSDTASLNSVQISTDGSLQGWGEVERSDNDIEDGGDVVLIAQLLELLLVFIGKSLTLNLMQDMWPDLVLQESYSETGEEHERAR